MGYGRGGRGKNLKTRRKKNRRKHPTDRKGKESKKTTRTNLCVVSPREKLIDRGLWKTLKTSPESQSGTGTRYQHLSWNHAPKGLPTKDVKGRRRGRPRSTRALRERIRAIRVAESVFPKNQKKKNQATSRNAYIALRRQRGGRAAREKRRSSQEKRIRGKEGWSH